MPPLPPLSRHLTRRWSRRLRPEGPLDHMVEALETLLQVASSQDPLFLLRGLELLVEHLGAEVAFLAMPEGDGFEVGWWSPEREDEPPPRPVEAFSRWLRENPFRMLVHRNLRDEAPWKDHPDLQGRDIGAAAGAVLRSEGGLRGLLFLHFRDPHPLGRSDLALVDAVAGFLAKVLEVEHLKFSLERLENALAITRAVVEDNSIQDPKTRLPNLRYLDIWLKVHAASAQEPMTVALWELPPDVVTDADRFQTLCQSVRGSDLLVSVNANRFLIVLQRTLRDGGHAFLQGLRDALGPWPMGATLWIPGEDDPHFERVRSRCETALTQSQQTPGGPLVWQGVGPG